MFRFTIVWVLFTATVVAQGGKPWQSALYSGPMIGQVGPDYGNVWLQLARPGLQVQLFLAEQLPQGGSVAVTAQVQVSDSAQQNVLKFRFENLKPATVYTLELMVENQPIELTPAPRFQTAPPTGSVPDSIVLVAGSCKLVLGKIEKDPRKSRRHSYPIYGRIHAENPDMMLWLGDNVYMRAKDHGSATRVYGRWKYERALPRMQPLLRTASHVAIWDDHEFGPNDCDNTFPHKQLNKTAHELFWANTQYGTTGCPGTHSAFRWGDVDVLLLDNRWYRRPFDEPNAPMLGACQLNWLVNTLRTSTASFKLVCMGQQVLNDSHGPPLMNSNYINLYRAEYNQLMDSLRAYRIQNVVFVTGDRHFSEFARLDTAGFPVLYDLTFSPISSPGMRFYGKDRNTRRLPKSYFGGQGYGLMTITGPAGQRVLHAQIKNKRGRMREELRIVQQPN